MKLDKIKVKRLNKVEADPKEYNDIIAFQFVEFEINFYGNVSTSTLDTKITKCGKQIVIDGDGFIPAGLDITNH